MTTATRHIGFCPICEGDFKLVDETKLVHHGYRRPGGGYIVGDCLSVHKQPYELSDEVCHQYQALLMNKLVLNHKYLSRLERGEVTSFMVERPKMNGHYREMVRVEIATPNGYDFIRELDQQIHNTKWEIKGLKNEIERMDKHIAAWTLKPVRTVEEELEKVRQAKAERKALSDARKAKKQAKADALKAKYAKWEQEKAELMAKWKGVFIELAAQVDAAATNNEMGLVTQLEWKALDLGRQMQKERGKKGYLNFYARDLEIDEVMLKLGLAEAKDRNGQVWVSHKF